MSFSPEKKLTPNSPDWVVNSKSCNICDSKFGLLNRKHHCRSCGN
jgi:growth factor-regulated tyrosine kinase substrate